MSIMWSLCDRYGIDENLDETRRDVVFRKGVEN
jgi:hypothetical protein